MLHAAAMLAGLFGLGLLLTGGWATREGALLALAAALLSLAAAMRLGGVRKTPFSTAPQFLVLLASRADPVVRGALATIRAALAADVTLAPALVRVRADAGAGFATAATADAISAEPGRVVVETDGAAMLVHVIKENPTDGEALAALHRRAAALLGRAS